MICHPNKRGGFAATARRSHGERFTSRARSSRPVRNRWSSARPLRVLRQLRHHSRMLTRNAGSLQHFVESAVRAYKIATTPPMGPVLLSLDAELQENPIADRACDRQSVRRGFAGAHPRELSGKVLSIGHHAGNDRLRVHLPEPACGARLRATRRTAGRSDRREDSRGYAADLTM